jgi:hypothetical protein
MNIEHMRHSASHIVGVLLSKVIAFNLSNGLQIEVLANKSGIDTNFLMGYKRQRRKQIGSWKYCWDTAMKLP